MALTRLTAPLGLLSVAGELCREGHNVQVIDALSFGLKPQKLRTILRNNNIQLVGISGATQFHDDIVALARLVKRFSSAIVVAGGWHATKFPEMLLKENCFDAVFRGAGERSLIEYIEYLQEKPNGLPDIKGICVRVNGKDSIRSTRAYVGLDNLSLPAWNLCPPTLYKGIPQGLIYRNWPYASIITSFGCPFNCTFCDTRAYFNNKVSFKSIDRVYREVRDLVTNYGVKEIQIGDDLFTLKRKRVVEFCQRIIDSGIKVNFSCPRGIHINSLDRELLQLMRKAGFYYLSLGIESGCQSTLNKIKKHIAISKIEEVAVMAHELGYVLNGFFILGFPFETQEEVQMTIDFANRLPIHLAVFGIFSPMKGTEETKRLIASGKLDENFDWTREVWSYGMNIDIYEHLTPSQVLGMKNRAQFRFYFKPRRFFYIVKHLFRMNPLSYYDFLYSFVNTFILSKWHNRNAKVKIYE